VTNTKRTILGIDPGSRITGFGVLAVENNQLKYVTSGVVTASGDDFPQRLRDIFTGLQTLIQTYAPTELAIEEVFMHDNPGSALKLGQARGAAIAATFSHDIQVYEYSARQIKQAVVGYGNATKEQVSAMVCRLLSLQGAPRVDATDALACALCHFHSIGKGPL
jgi:crossover junction endodeoxyribonuclease RuvC